MIELLLSISKFFQSIILTFTLGFYFVNYFIIKNFKYSIILINRISLYLIVLLILSVIIFFVQVYYRYEDINEVLNLSHIIAILFDTRFGEIWLIKFLIFILLIVLCRIRDINNILIIFLLSLSLGLGSLTGHAISSDIIYVSIPVNFIHIVSVSLWVGSLPYLFLSISKSNTSSINHVKSFSSFASYNMVFIIFSGFLLSLINLDYSFAALLGTDYGQIIIFKLLFVSIALLCALYIRMSLLNGQKFLKINFSIKNILKLEIISVAFIFAIGIFLSQTVPGAHDEIDWPLNFRLSIDVAMEDPINKNSILFLLIFISLILGIILMDFILNKKFSKLFFCSISIISISGLTIVYYLSIEAYPVTYKRPSVPYSAISVYNGKLLYRNNCIQCHGYSGHGDGIMVNDDLEILPANLTEPHTAYHTAGDIYWWLTNGMPPSIMPGFDGILSEDNRWDLINFLRTLSSGYEARILSDKIVYKKPWLPAVDFDFVTLKGKTGRLSQYRGKKTIILIIMDNITNYENRINQIIKAYDQIKELDAEVLLVPSNNIFKQVGFNEKYKNIPFPIIYEGSEEILETYNLYRRTILNPDKKDENERMEYIEFLIDQYGYIRSRWKKDEINDVNKSLNYLSVINELKKEGKILDYPDEHVH